MRSKGWRRPSTASLPSPVNLNAVLCPALLIPGRIPDLGRPLIDAHDCLRLSISPDTVVQIWTEAIGLIWQQMAATLPASGKTIAVGADSNGRLKRSEKRVPKHAIRMPDHIFVPDALLS
jgi:hypothetical protein